MKSNEMVNQIRTLLNIEVKLERQKLQNGTVIEAESFEKGKEVFIVTDDEKVALPVGEYILEDGRLLVSEEEGMISDMREPDDGVPQKEEPEETEDLDHKEDHNDEDMGYEKKMEKMVELEERMKNLEDAVEDLKKEKVEASDSVLKSRTVKEEFNSEDKEEVKENLSTEPMSQAIKHSPEGESTKEMKFVYSENRINTTLDRILNKISNIK